MQRWTLIALVTLTLAGCGDDDDDGTDADTDTDTDSDTDSDSDDRPTEGGWVWQDVELKTDPCFLGGGYPGMDVVYLAGPAQFQWEHEGTSEPMTCTMGDAKSYLCDPVRKPFDTGRADATATWVEVDSGQMSTRNLTFSLFTIELECEGDGCQAWAEGNDYALPCTATTEYRGKYGQGGHD